MNFVHHPEQLRESVQHRVGSVVHQADGVLHSPRRSSHTRFLSSPNLPYADLTSSHARDMCLAVLILQNSSWSCSDSAD